MGTDTLLETNKVNENVIDENEVDLENTILDRNIQATLSNSMSSSDYFAQQRLMEFIAVFLDKKEAGRCNNFGFKSKTYVSCKKCNINLCIARNQNCFDSFHSK